MSNGINFYQAIWHAFIGKEENPNTSATEEILKKLQTLTGTEVDFKDQTGRAKESLEEVKKLTEYQDQKVARLLTIIAFLTAAASTIFSRAFEIHPFPQNLGNLWHTVPLFVFYALFAAYLIITGLGALVSFYAMQTRFSWSEQQENRTPSSFLFFRGIASTSPEAWANAFLESNSKSLAIEYYKNYILESYLVATKIKEKLKYLQPGQRLLQIAIRFLIFWFISLFLVLALVPKGAAQSASMKVAQVPNTPKTSTNGAAVQPAHTSSAPSAAKSP